MPQVPASITSIPNAIHYLVTLYGTTCPIDSNNEPILVWFGTELGAWSSPTTIEINGVDPANQEPAEMGPNYRREEVYSIKCKVTVFSGEGMNGTIDFLSRMDDCFTIWKALAKALANDTTLGGNVRYSEVGEMAYEPITDGSGRAAGTLLWVVRCSARVTSLS